MPCFIVTGACGFIGANLVGELLRRDPGSRVLGVDDLRSGFFENLVDSCARIAGCPYSGDLCVADTATLDWLDLVDSIRPRAVFHLAAITDTTIADERTMIVSNLEGFRPILDACIETGTPLVYASSAATYGSPREGAERQPFPEPVAGRPNNVYGFSKWLMENLHRESVRYVTGADQAAPHVVGLRLFNVFGPGESRKGKMASMAAQLTHQILSGSNPRLFRDGEQSRDQVYVMDVVECLLAASMERAIPGVYNCGSGIATSFNQLVDAVREGLGRTASDAPTEFFEMPAAVRAFYQDFTCANLAAVKKQLGWTPRFPPRESIRDYAAHLAEFVSR